MLNVLWVMQGIYGFNFFIHSFQVSFGNYVIHAFYKDMKIYYRLKISSVTDLYFFEYFNY